MKSFQVTAVLRAVHPEHKVKVETFRLGRTIEADNHNEAIDLIKPYLTVPGEYEIVCQQAGLSFPGVKYSKLPASSTQSRSSTS